MPLPDVTGLSNTADFQQAVSSRIAAPQESRVLRKDRRGKVAALSESPYETSASSVKGDDTSPKFTPQPGTDLRLRLTVA